MQAALRQVASEASRASRADSDLISCREACKSLEDQVADANRRYSLHHIIQADLCDLGRLSGQGRFADMLRKVSQHQRTDRAWL